MIAGLPRSPSRDNPAASIARAHDRRAYVLRRMAETGKIDEGQREAADRAPLNARRTRRSSRSRRPISPRWCGRTWCESMGPRH